MLNTLGSKTNARSHTLSALPFATKREPCYDPKENRSIADRMDEKSQERESFSFTCYCLFINYFNRRLKIKERRVLYLKKMMIYNLRKQYYYFIIIYLFIFLLFII